jgi:hypothetical protein
VIALLACETGIAPNDLLATHPSIIDTMLDYLAWRAKKRR